MALYSAGAISIAQNGTALSGSGTAWLSSGIASGWFIPLGAPAQWYQVQSVNSDISITLATNYEGATLSGVSYVASDTVNSNVSGTNVVFYPSWSGAASRTASDKLADLVSVKDAGAKGDTIVFTGACSITSGAAALAVTGASFTAKDVNKAIIVPGAGASGGYLVTTISGYTDATHITLGANASTTLSASSQTITYGTDDTTAFQSAITQAVATGAPCFIPGANYYLSGSLNETNSAASALPNFFCTLWGAGGRGANLLFAPGNYNGIVITGSSTSTAAESMILVQGLGLYKSDRQGAGLYLAAHAHINVKDVFAQGWNLGCWGFDIQESVFENVVCVYNNGGAQFQKNTFTQPNALLLLNCTFGLNYNFGLDVQNPSAFKMVGGSIESNGQAGGNTGTTANSIWGARIVINTSSTEGSIAAHFDAVYIENNGSTTAGVGIGDIYYSNSSVESMLSVTNCTFQRHSYFCTNNIAISTSGGFRHKIRLQNGHKGYADYTASATRPYWQVYSTTDPIEVDDTGSLYYSTTESPQSTGQYAIPSSVRCAQSNLGGYVRFNGTGTPAIASNFGVYSVVRNSTGNYTITFNRAQTATGSRCFDVGLNAAGSWYIVSETSTTVVLQTINLSGAATDFSTIMVKWNADPTQ